MASVQFAGYEDDFRFSLDRASGLITDAGCSIRSPLRVGRLPAPHRRLLSRALGKLESAQQDLFTARNSPWRTPAPRRHEQLELI